ncbi:hypothetical protein C1H46_042936 [Malus baccata]|uniref:Uncharacterized protein n=1 Tax=Malus baccata TaxID=106549 RepID=A0A540KBC9_MALBA|nr:hypothetical protein C1H46_042936 [Malus baccata]
MAKGTRLTTATVCTCLIFLIFCHEMVHVEGRHLKCKKCSSRHSHETTSTITARLSNTRDHHHKTGGGFVGPDHDRTSKIEHLVDDFRPTAPGHSPGVGHSIKN